jgi:hypothetical protein
MYRKAGVPTMGGLAPYPLNKDRKSSKEFSRNATVTLEKPTSWHCGIFKFPVNRVYQACGIVRER